MATPTSNSGAQDLVGASNAGAARPFNPVAYLQGIKTVMYAAIESFGSICVATFWFLTNSTWSFTDAARYYDPIIATAQLGAIGGSTLVASGRWEPQYLLVVVAFFIILHLIVMHLYDRKFEPTSVLAVEATPTTTRAAAAARVSPAGSLAGATGEGATDDSHSVVTWQDNNATLTKPFWSGFYLIFQNDYNIFGVRCCSWQLDGLLLLSQPVKGHDEQYSRSIERVVVHSNIQFCQVLS